MKTIDELYGKWNSISPFSDGYLLVSGDHPLAFHIGYTGDSQKTFVVLNTGKVDKVSSSKAVQVNNIQLRDGTYALSFLLKYPTLDELFVKLCWDLMEASRDAEQPLMRLIDQYKKWQRLLQQIREGLLSPSMQKGLIGEMLFLESRIACDGEHVAITGWVGPEGSDQDFNYEHFWAEIKTTTIAGTSVAVSSLQQLDRNDNGYLVVYFMDPTDSAGLQSISLDEAVNKVSCLLTDDAIKNQFECKLARVGYQHRDAEKYHAHRYRCASRTIFAVTDDFPRLTKNCVPAEVVGAKYDLNLPAIERFQRQEIM